MDREEHGRSRVLAVLLLFVAFSAAIAATTSQTTHATPFLGHTGTPVCGVGTNVSRCRVGRGITLDVNVQGAMVQWEKYARPCVIRSGSDDTFAYHMIQIVEDGNPDEWIEFGYHRTTLNLPLGTPHPLSSDESANELYYAYGTGDLKTGSWATYAGYIKPNVPYQQIVQARKTVDGRRWRLFVGEKPLMPFFPVDHATNATIALVGGETDNWSNDLGVLEELALQVRWGGTWKGWFPAANTAHVVNRTSITTNGADNRYLIHYGNPGSGFVQIYSDHHIAPGECDACGEDPFATPTP